MALKDILKTLEAEAEARIKEIEDKSKQEIKELKAEHSRRMKKERERFLTVAKVKAQKDAEMKLFAKKFELKNEVLNRKREIINQVYNQALDKLRKLPDSEYGKIIKKLFKNITGEGEGVIIPAKGREGITKKAAYGMNLKVADKSIDSAGGFVWQSEKVNFDNTFEQLLDDIRHETEMEVARELFK